MRREYAGAARKARLATALGGTALDLGILGDDLTGWPDGSGGPFFVVIGRGTASEEKILCSSRTGNSLTVYTDGLLNGRGADGTNIVAHDYNDFLEHIWTATDADEANKHVNDTANVHGVTSHVVGVSDTQTLTNKTIDGNANTITNVPESGVTGLVGDLAALNANKANLAGGATFTGPIVLPATTSIGSVSDVEIGYVDGATSNIQAQLNAKAPINNPTFTGTVSLPSTTSIGSVTGSEIAALDGVISNLQGQITAITGGGTSVPPGGDENWILVKNSAADYDMSWKPASDLIFIPGTGSDTIAPDGSITGYDSTGTYTVGSVTFRWCKWTTTGITMNLIAGVPVVGQLLVCAAGAGGGGGSQSSGSGEFGGGGGGGGVWYGDYAFGTGIHNLRVGAGGLGGNGSGLFGTAATGSDGEPSWIDNDGSGFGGGGVYVPGGGGGGGASWGTGAPGRNNGCGGGGGGGGGQGAAGTGLAPYGTNGSGNTGGGAMGAGLGRFLDITGTSIEYGKGVSGSYNALGTNGVGMGGGGGRGDAGVNPGFKGGDGVIIARYRIA